MTAIALSLLLGGWLTLAVAIVIPLCRLICKAKKYSGEN